MATCRDIVNGALRKIGKLAGGREPRTQDSSDALDALRGLYRSLITSGAFGRLSDAIPTGAEYTARENERIFRNSDATITINLPETVSVEWCGPRPYDEEWATYPTDPTDRNERPPRDCSVVIIHDAFTAETTEFIYDGQQKLWQPLYGLTLDSDAPLSYRDAEGLKCLLATMINDEFGGELGQMTVMMANQFKTALTHRYSMPATIGYTEYF